MNVRGIIRGIILIAGAAMIFVGARAAREVSYRTVDLRELMRNPQSYDGKPIRTVGYIKLDYGVQGIFLSPEDGHDFEKGMWLEISEELRGNRGDYDQQYCVLEGIVNVKNRGRLSRWNGAIEEITWMELWG